MTPKTVALFACISERAQQLMQEKAHANDAQVCAADTLADSTF